MVSASRNDAAIRLDKSNFLSLTGNNIFLRLLSKIVGNLSNLTEKRHSKASNSNVICPVIINPFICLNFVSFSIITIVNNSLLDNYSQNTQKNTNNKQISLLNLNI